jgi:hypothetical protein
LNVLESWVLFYFLPWSACLVGTCRETLLLHPRPR